MDFVENKQFWEDAVNTRHSCRRYQNRPIKDEVMEKLKRFSNLMDLPFEHNIELRFFKSDGCRLTNNLKNTPTDCLAFLSSTDLLSIG